MLQIKINSIQNFPLSIKSKVLEALSNLNEIVNSEKFKYEFLKLNFVAKNGLNNQQILDLFLSGKDIFESVADFEIDLNLNYYFRRWSRVIGYTTPQSSSKIYCNGYQYSRMSKKNIAANILHEYFHLLGFIDPNVEMTRSVPYLAGNLIEKLYSEKYQD